MLSNGTAIFRVGYLIHKTSERQYEVNRFCWLDQKDFKQF